MKIKGSPLPDAISWGGDYCIISWDNKNTLCANSVAQSCQLSGTAMPILWHSCANRVALFTS
nr:hypothetical protein [uncultured Bacteroides sp.]